MFISQISIFVENKVGALSTITGVLKDANIDIRALSLADTTDFGILRLIVDDPERAEKELKKNGITVSKTRVIAAGFDDVPGAFHGVIEALAGAGIAIEYTYAFATPRNGKAYVILRVEDGEGAVAALVSNGIELLGPDVVYKK